MYYIRNLTHILILCICISICLALNSDPLKEDSVSGDEKETYGEKTSLGNDSIKKKSLKDSEKINAAAQSNLDSILNRYAEAIEKHEIEKGPYNRQLSEMLYGLGQKLQFNRRPNEAIKLYRKAIYINRINDGLYGLSQDILLRAIIKSQKSQGKINETAASYNQLLQIYSKNYDENDPDLMLMMEEFSQWSLSAYRQTGGRDDVYHLEVAFQLYSDAIRVSKKHLGESNTNLLPLLNSLSTACYYLSVHQRLYPDYGKTGSSVPFGYRSMTPINQVVGRGAYFKHGRMAQDQILQILEENTDFSEKEKALGQTNLGDWYLLFGKYQLAVSAYKKAYDIIAGDEKAKEVLDKIYSKPVMLPKNNGFFDSKLSQISKAASSLKSKSSLPSTTNYVNLLADITAAGNAINFNVQKIHSPEIHEYSDRAIATVRSRKFRPRLKNGIPELTSAFPIRVIIPNE